jgi:hypothetical protein
VLLFSTIVGCSSPVDPPDPPGGGEEFVLSFELFQSSVEPVLASFGCNTTDCHGGGIRGTFELSPPGDSNVAFDFEQASLQVAPYDRLASPLLTNPLAEPAGGEPHSYEPFATADDEGYQAILSWIEAGEFR